jgi:hypothetical protein
MIAPMNSAKKRITGTTVLEDGRGLPVMARLVCPIGLICNLSSLVRKVAD